MGDGDRAQMKLTGDVRNTPPSGSQEAASQARVELTWEVVRNGGGESAIKMMLTFATISVEFLTWGNRPVPT